MKKDDPNYIVGLEKAIKKKYGEEAIENPAKFWDVEKERKYINQLDDFIKKQKKYETSHDVKNVDGVLISHKLLNKEGIISCPICRIKTKTVNDDVYIAKFECCSKCYIQYVDGRESRWLEGWRPKNVTEDS